MHLISESVFAAAVEQLIGTTIQTTHAGPGTGSIFTMNLRAPTREEHHLMVFCAWKLLRAGTITCTWRDAEEDLAAALAAHQRETLAGARVESGGDLVLTLASGAELKLFADGRVPDEPADQDQASDYFLQQGLTTFVSLRGAFYQENTPPRAKKKG
ncbi:hypothetical protein [Hymenobacter yonginensis]|uniref:Uncharacterized protein n=1 Tax=Hymenobacter yonginensis TaxID=748197 RepID=A0ABY7PVN3_9BACT|nr:hypothetical protein [Hymenobacter yonginensis]WBO86722.1 hypothetical protein O9Z63_20795 [Hymenobacter yonginensis]